MAQKSCVETARTLRMLDMSHEARLHNLSNLPPQEQEAARVTAHKEYSAAISMLKQVMNDNLQTLQTTVEAFSTAKLREEIG